MFENGSATSWDYIPVKDVMNQEPVTVSPKMRINFAAALMNEKDISCLIVTRKNEPIGSLSEKDITRQVVAEDLKPNKVTVRDIMKRPIITISPDEDLASVARTMAGKGIWILAVMENRKLIGVISQRDLFSLSPTILELSREHAKINNNGLKVDNYTPGYCEMCHAYSDELEEKDGVILCKNCTE